MICYAEIIIGISVLDEVATVILEKESRVVDGLTLVEDGYFGTLILEGVVGIGVLVLDGMVTVILIFESGVGGTISLLGSDGNDTVIFTERVYDSISVLYVLLIIFLLSLRELVVSLLILLLFLLVLLLLLIRSVHSSRRSVGVELVGSILYVGDVLGVRVVGGVGVVGARWSG